jgi:transmembrane sensor
VWEVIPGAARFSAPACAPAMVRSRARRAVPARLAAGIAFVAIVAALAWSVLRQPSYTTAVGQQQIFTLEDGTRVSLNTNSKLRVAYRAHERRLVLERGEGLFEVAKEADRPFIVESGEQQVTALGTTFIMRKDLHALAVTLIEGKVAVARQRSSADRADAALTAVILAPGQRVIVRDDAKPALDTPALQTVTAWRRGEVIFDDASLRDAAAEINRYGTVRVVLATPALAQLRVSGVFGTRDPQEFARAMAQLHKLSVRRESGEIVLAERAALSR